MSKKKMTALVTGANRGIGFEVCRQLAKQGYRVILAARFEGKGVQAAESLQKEGLDVQFRKLDITLPSDVEALAESLKRDFGGIDVLVNNAGVFLDDRDSENSSVFATKLETIRQTFETNVLGGFHLIQKCLPMMLTSGFGRIVNVSSGMGQLSEMNGGYPAYRISKTALNAVTRIFADEASGHNILVNSVCPGWVKTDMGGPAAEREVAEGADTVVWLATLPNGGPTGGFFRDREPIAW